MTGSTAGTPAPLRAGTGLAGRAAPFVWLTLGVSWLAWAASGLIADSPDGSPVAFALWAVGGMAPALVALGLTARAGGQTWTALLQTLRRWRLGRWSTVLLLPLPVATAAVLIAIAVGWAAWEPSGLAQWYLLPVMVLGGVIFGGVEEIGWRGYLQPRLQADTSALAANLLLGIIWALWHLPLFALDGSTQASLPFGWFVLQSIALSVVFGWVRNRTGSTLLVVLLHGSVNASFLASVSWFSPDAAGAALPVAAGLATAAAAAIVIHAGPALGLPDHEPSEPARPARTD